METIGGKVRLPVCLCLCVSLQGSREMSIIAFRPYWAGTIRAHPWIAVDLEYGNRWHMVTVPTYMYVHVCTYPASKPLGNLLLMKGGYP